MHVLQRKLRKDYCDLELFRNVSVHEFYCLKALITLEQVNTSMVQKKKKLISKTLMVRLTGLGVQPRPQGFSLKKWVGREKALHRLVTCTA